MPESYLIDKAKLLSDIWDDLAFLEGSPVSARDAAKYLDDLVRKQPTIEPELKTIESVQRSTKGCSYCKGRAYSKKPLTVITRNFKRIETVFNFCPCCGRSMMKDAGSKTD